MAQSHRHRRLAFSLVELLINLAIISALVGMAVSLYEGFTYEAQAGKARQDLETFRGAIQRYEQGGHKLGGTSLRPLVGAGIQELPVDPWGLDYVLDGNLGLLATLGADGRLYGSGADQDIITRYNALLTPVDAVYEGPFGPPVLGNRVRLTTSKVFGILPGMSSQVANDIVLVRKHGAVPFVPLGLLGFTLDWGETQPNDGLLVLTCTNPALNTWNIPISGNDLVNFSPMVISFAERPSEGSPFAEDVGNFVLGPRPFASDILGLKLRRVGF